MFEVKPNEDGLLTYYGDTFRIVLRRYSDPHRENMAFNAAKYLGKPTPPFENKADEDAYYRRPLNIIRAGHVPEVLRGEMAEFLFIDVSKEVYDHLITYTTRNMRVAGGNRALTSDDFTMPSDKMKNPALVGDAISDSMSNYQALLEAGETPQVARSAMPVNAKLNDFVYQFNFVTLGKYLFAQRIWEKGAQGNTVKVVRGMWELVHHVDPELWDTIYKWWGLPAIQWTEVRRKLDKWKLTVDQLIVQLLNNCSPDQKAEEALVRLFGEQKTHW